MTDPSQQAVIYCRVSSKSHETDGHGLESQETRCREYAATKGLSVAAVFPDTITGGVDFMKRPGMVALLSFLDAQPDRQFTVIFDDLKRFARETRFHLALRDAFRQRGARIECLNFKLDDSPEGEFIETIIAAQGALERKQNGRQVAQKMKARMQSGYWIHNAPIGYRFEAVKGRGRMLFPNPPFDAIIREAYEGYASGRFASQAEVRRFFESFPDFPKGKTGGLTNQRVADILTQAVYAGYICSETYGITWLKGQHDPLISVETFEKVQERRKGHAHAPQRKNIGKDFALRGMVSCAECGTPLRSSWAKGRSKHYAYYLCQTKGCEAYGKSTTRDRLEGEVGDLIKTLQPTKGLVTLTTAMFRAAWDARCDQAKDIIRAGKRQIKDLDKQMDTLLTRLIDAANPAVIRKYEDRIGELEKEKRILAEKLTKQAEPKGSFEEKLEPALTFLANPWKLWETGHITLRRTLLKLAFQGSIQYCRNEGPRTAKTTLPFKVLEGVLKDRILCGAAERTRTSGPIITNDVLYHLSYSGVHLGFTRLRGA